MTAIEVLAFLEAHGTAQARKIYQRHGAGPQVYGVSFADLGALKKKIKTDHALALELWASGYHEARLLAAQVADPAQVTDRLLNTWVKDLDNYALTDTFTDLVARTPLAQKKMEKWITAQGEWVSRAGWRLVGYLAMHAPDLPNDFFAPHLAQIEQAIHTRPNRTRDAMNNALIAIALRNRPLEKHALSAAKAIGKVEVDHGQTSCKTPDAAAYIRKTLAYRKAKASKK